MINMICKNCQSENADNRTNCWYCDKLLHPHPIISTGTNISPDYKSIAKGCVNNDNIALKHEKTHLLDLHKIAYKFNITRPHDFKRGKPFKMRGWTGRALENNDFSWHVTPHLIIIWTRERVDAPHREAETVKEQWKKDITAFAIKFARENDLEIDPTPIPHSKEVKVRDFKVAENFRLKNVKSVYPPPCEIEFTDKRTAIKDSVRFVSDIDKYRQTLEDVNQSIQDFNTSIQLEIYNKQLHTSVLNDIKDAMKLLQEQSRKTSLLEKLKRFFR